MVAKDIRITIKRNDGEFIDELSSTREVESIIKEVSKKANLKFLENGMLSDGIVDIIVAAYKIGVRDVDRNFKANVIANRYFDEEKEKITVEVE